MVISMIQARGIKAWLIILLILAFIIAIFVVLFRIVMFLLPALIILIIASYLFTILKKVKKGKIEKENSNTINAKYKIK